MPKPPAGAQHARRRTVYDYVQQAEGMLDQNKYCKKEVLLDEPSVEQFFISRLLKDLGYEDAEIRPKNTLEEIAISRGGRKKENYRPDYAIVTRGKPRWVMEAKSPGEDVDQWSYQTAGYALALNQRFSGENPCQFYALSNGYVFKVFRWDEADSRLTLEFGDFFDDNARFLELR